jgi:hypothetical protein
MTRIATLALAAGLPVARQHPAQANILYNILVREQLARRDTEIAAQNAERRRQLKLVVVPQPRSGRKS